MTNYSVLKKGKRYFYYKCTDPQCRNAINAEKLDTAVLEKVKAAPTDEAGINEALEIWKELRIERMETAEPMIKQFKDDIAKLSDQEKKIQNMFLSGIVNTENQSYWNDELSAVIFKKKNVEERLEKQLDIIEANRIPMVTPATIMQQAKHWSKVMDMASTAETKRNLLLARVQKIQCKSKGEFQLDLVMTKNKKWLRRLEPSCIYF